MLTSCCGCVMHAGPIIIAGSTYASDTLVGLTSYGISPNASITACADPAFGGVYTDIGSAPMQAYITATEASFASKQPCLSSAASVWDTLT